MSAMNELTGRTLGAYQILEEIGRGGMAVVYRAYQPSLNRRVAIKVLPASLAIDPDFVQRFLQEARAAANLDHPNIVTVHDVGQQDGTYYIVMQELPGESLNALIRREGRLPAQRASAILAQVASALDYAHSRGFVHRDVKPGNIIVGPGDRAVLTDFGIAKALAGTQLTQSGVMVGTPQYMAPEQIKGEPVGPATDIYALGIVLYEMLSGRPPFDAENITAVMYKQVHEQPASVRTAAPALPAAVDQVLAVALSKSPAQRFKSAVVMASTLSAALAGQRVDAAARGPAAGARVPTPAPGPKRVRRNWLVLGGLALVLALVVALLALAGGDPEGPPSQPPLAVAAPSATPAPAGSGAASPPATAASAPSDPAPPAGDARSVAVSSQAVNTYTGPGREFSVQGQMDAGDPKEIIGRSADGSWLLLCCVDGDPAWVEAFLVAAAGELGALPAMTVAAPAAASAPTATATPPATATPTASAVPPTPTPSAPELVIQASTANVRSGPGASYPEVGQVRQGEALAITGKNADASWWQVCCVAGQPGWTRADLGEARGSLSAVTAVDAPPPPQPTPCGRPAGPTFDRVWDRAAMGCPLTNETGVLTAYEGFENGFMLWRQDDDGHYAAYGGGAYDVFYYPPAEPPDFSCPESAQLGRPRRGFSKVWCENPQVRQRIGNAQEDEIGDYRPTQVFEKGFMIYIKERGRIYFFAQDRSWREIG